MKFLSIHFLSFEHSQEIHNNVYFTIPSSSSSSIVSSNYTKIVQDNRRIKKILSFAKILVYLRSLCETRFRVIFHQLETNSIPLSWGMFRWVVRDFFFFFILDACALQKHGISLSIAILKL